MEYHQIRMNLDIKLILEIRDLEDLLREKISDLEEYTVLLFKQLRLKKNYWCANLMQILFNNWTLKISIYSNLEMFGLLLFRKKLMVVP